MSFLCCEEGASVSSIDFVKSKNRVVPKRVDSVHETITQALDLFCTERSREPKHKKEFWDFLMSVCATNSSFPSIQRADEVERSKGLRIEGKVLDYDAFRRRAAVVHLA